MPKAKETTADSGTPEPRARRSMLRRMFDRLAAEPEDLQAEELRTTITEAGATPIGRCPDREPVTVAGTLRTVTLRPRAGTPALEAELWDGTGSVVVVWLGRREIPGITAGRNIVVRGRITTFGGHRAIYNPIYELRPNAG